jgi:trimethylamine:corrinoid methyltransferase-like protein
MPRIGHHGTYDRWEAQGRPDVVGQAREVAMAAIAGHQPLPFADGVADELARLEQAARGG